MHPRTDESARVEIERAVEHFKEPTCRLLAELLRILCRNTPRAGIECAQKATGILFQLSPSQQAFFLSRAIEIARFPEGGRAQGSAPTPEISRFSEAAAEFFLNCADLLFVLDEDDLRVWVENGLAIGRENLGAATAFFRQESLAGVSQVQRLRRSVHLGEMSRLLRLYCSAMAGKSLEVKRTTEAPPALVRQGHHLPLTDGRTVFLPELVNNHPLREQNFEEYKVLAAHQSGYIEFGTFEFDVDVLLDHPEVSPFCMRGAGTPVESHYELFFRLFEDRQLARDIFFAVEDGRIDFRLCATYKGLAPQIRSVARASIINRPAPHLLPLREGLVEALVRLSLMAEVEEMPGRPTHEALAEVRRIFGRVLNEGATVNDSALATLKLYSLLQGVPNAAFESVEGTAAPEISAAHSTGLPSRAGEEFGIQEREERPYHPSAAVPYRGQTMPELVQLEAALDLLRESATDSEGEGIPLTREMLEELIRRGAKIKIGSITAKELSDTSGLFITDLRGVLQEKLKEMTLEERKRFAKLKKGVLAASEAPACERVFFYDEWDYLIGDYRDDWCRVREMALEGGSVETVARIRKERSALISAVRRHFQRIRPEMLKRVKRLRSGEELEMDDAIDAVIDRKAGITPSERIYQKRERKTRDVATAFLLDLSASTDEWIVEEPAVRPGRARSASQGRLLDYFAGGASNEEGQGGPTPGTKRVIDIEQEALVIMAEALESLGDEYAIYGFSGYGRENIEFFPIKEFSESYSEQVRRRIGAIRPRKSTRMGPAIRHAIEKLGGTGSRLKALILLSDGYPQDFDYGPDRTSRDYGLHDTMMALREAKRRNVHTFCVTVDQAGNDYLREMCGGENYLVVKRPSALPRILPRVYRGLTV
ncbi:MAG: hypothetical protein Kow0099_24530 [Candidatus Abyssubacteria bacterium]